VTARRAALEGAATGLCLLGLIVVGAFLLERWFR